MRILLVLLLAAFTAADALACSCIQLGEEPADPAAGAEVVFLGTVVGTDLLFASDDGVIFAAPSEARKVGGYLMRVTVLRVTERYKGEVEPFAIVTTGGGGGDCGYGFEEGKTYVVYANTTDDAGKSLTTSICSNTALESDSKERLTKLRKLHPPTAPARAKFDR